MFSWHWHEAYPSLVTRLLYFARIIPPRRQPGVIHTGPAEIAFKVDKIRLRLTGSPGGRRRIPPRRPSTAATPAAAADTAGTAAPDKSHIGRLGKSRVRSLVPYLLLRALRGGLEQ